MMGGMSMSRLGGRLPRGAAALTVVVAALLGVSACSASATSSGPAAGSTQQAGSTQPTGSTQQPAGPIIPAHSTLHWHSCSGQLAAYGVPDCTMLSVPLNYADPGGRHISLALDMIPATAPKSQQQGIMLVNPGGPGVSGLSLAAEVAQGLSRGVAAELRHRGLRPAWRRVLGARAQLRSRLFLRRAPELYPGQCRRRAGAHQ